MKISIVVPIYNVETYLEKCIESIIAQDYKNIEIILVDDGSIDKSGLICDYYAGIDDRITVIHQENIGLSGARKAGISIATGEYVLNVDGDDWIDKDRIQTLVADGINRYTSPDMIYLSGIVKEYHDRAVVEKDIDTILYYEGECACVSVINKLVDKTKCFKHYIRANLVMWAVKTSIIREQYLKLDNSIVYGEDQTGVWMCLLRSKTIGIIPQGGYHYVQRMDSICRKRNTISEKNLENIYWLLKDNIENNKYKSEIMDNFYFLFSSIAMFQKYEYLLNRSNYLFPYPEVLPNSKIVIYGAGRFGREIVRGIITNGNYKIVGWVDREPKQYENALPKVESIATINEMTYDYIVVAIYDSEIACSAKINLVTLGVPEDKIALMSPECVLKLEIMRNER